jgi:Transposase DDE domain
MLPTFYQTHLKSQLGRTEYLVLRILIHLLQSIKQVNLEVLATALPLPILFESRRKKLQRFLSIPEWNIETIWFPILRSLFSTYFQDNQVLYLAIDRTSWAKINLLMISLIWHKRAIPIYFELLPKLGNSNLEEQTTALSKVLPLFQKYQLIVLGDREFCSVMLASWLRTQSAYFCLRLKKDEYVQQASLIWQQLQDSGLSPGVSFFLQGVRVTKKKKIAGFNVALKWKRKYQGWTPEEGWFILTNLDNLSAAIAAYSRRFGIEEMFRDFKSGGYNLEDTNVSGERLIALILLIAIAYSSATLFGAKIKRMGVQKYVGRVKEHGHPSRRHSNFYIGLYGYTWIDFMVTCEEFVTELMRLNPNKQQYYRQGKRAMRLILSAS